MLKDLAKEKDAKTEKEMPKMSQVLFLKMSERNCATLSIMAGTTSLKLLGVLDPKFELL